MIHLKNILLFFVLLLLTSFQETFSQYNVIKVDALALIFPNPRGLRASYERSLGDHVSLLGTIEKMQYASGEQSSGSSAATAYPNNSMSTVYEVDGWGIMPEIRYFPFTQRKPAPVGFFIGAHFRYRWLQEGYHENNVNITSRGNAQDLGLNAGYSLNAGSFMFDFLVGYGGGGGTWTSSSGDRNKIDPFFRDDLSDFTNFLRLEASVGIVFPRVPRKKHELEIPK